MSDLKFDIAALIANPDDYTSSERKQAAEAVDRLFSSARRVDQTDREFWTSTIRNPERLAERFENAMADLRAALARIGSQP